MNKSREILKQKLEAFLKRHYRLKISQGFILWLAVALLWFLGVSVLEWFLQGSSDLRSLLFWVSVVAIVASAWPLYLKHSLQALGLLRGMSYRQVAVAVGKHFNGIDDQILSALELGDLAEEQEGLLFAAMEQKVERLKDFSFAEAVDIEQFKRVISYSLGSLLLVVLLMFTEFRGPLWESSQRILRFTEEFVPPAPFRFVLLNDSLSLEKGEALRIAVRTEGGLVPSEMLLIKGNEEVRMRRSEPQEWLWLLESCQSAFSFRFKADGYLSDEYRVELLALPRLSGSFIEIKPPAYTGLSDQEQEFTGDVLVPEGSELELFFSGDNLDSIWWPRSSDTLSSISGRMAFIAEEEQVFSLFGLHEERQRRLFAPVNIRLIPDAYPQIALKWSRDSASDRTDISGTYSDDYGVRSLERVLVIDGKEYKGAMSLDGSGRFGESLSLDSLASKQRNREVLLYYKICDNDGYNGSKCRESERIAWLQLSERAKEEQARSNIELLRVSGEERKEEQRRLQEFLSEMQDKAKSSKSGDWKDQQKIEELLERLNESLKEQERRREEFKRNLESLEDSEELKERLKEDEESQQSLEELLEELEKLKNELDLNKMKERLDRLQSEQQRQMQQEERMDKLLEDLLFQRDLLEQVQKLEDLAKGLEEGADIEALEKDYSETKEKLEDLKEQDASLKEEMNNDSFEEAQEQTEEAMDEIGEMSKAGQESSKSQKKGAEGAKKMAQSLRNAFQKRQKQALQANMESLRRILANLEHFSHGVEESAQQISSLESGDPRFRDLLKQQALFDRSIKVAEDSLLLLAEKAPQIRATVFEELSNMQAALAKASAELQEQAAAKAAAYDQRAMMAANSLALLLEESLDNMMAMMAQQKEGKQNCEKPGQGKPKPGSEGQQMQELGEAIGKLPKGKKPGKEGGRGMSQSDQADLLKKQEALRELLKNEVDDKGGGDKPGGQEMGRDLDNLEDAILEGDPELIRERFERLESRMLESERAEEERKQKEEREAEQGSYLQMREGSEDGGAEELKEEQEEVLHYRPLRLSPFYRNKNR